MNEPIQEWLPLGFQLGAYVFLSPLAVGFLRFFKARLQGRRGASVTQPYRDLFKLVRKQTNVPDSTSPLFFGSAIIVFTSMLLLGVALPLPTAGERVTVDGLLVIYLFGLAKFAGALAAFDAAAPFGPMSSGRQFFIHILAEPALLVVLYVSALVMRTTELGALGRSTQVTSTEALPALVLGLIALVVLALAEGGRLPFDNPASHLELTMIEQGARLEYSGRALLLLEWADAMKLSFFLSLIATLTFYWLPSVGGAMHWFIDTLTHGAVMVVLLFALAWAELARAKLRLRAVATPLLFALGAAVVAVVYVVMISPMAAR